MRLSATLLLAAGLALAAIGVLGAPAAGAADKAPRTAKFKAQIKGEQVITWSYNTDPQAPCYGGENAGGSARMLFESTKPTKVTAMEVKKGTPLWNATYQRVMFAPAIRTFATAQIEGNHTSGPVPNPDACDDHGGGVTPVPDQCGTATALIDVTLGYVNKNRLLVKGDATSWDPGAVEFRSLFDHCPWWQGGPYTRATAEGDLEPAAAKLKESKLFKKSAKKITLRGSLVDCWDQVSVAECGGESGPFRGKTTTTWTLKLKRMK